MSLGLVCGNGGGLRKVLGLQIECYGFLCARSASGCCINGSVHDRSRTLRSGDDSCTCRRFELFAGLGTGSVTRLNPQAVRLQQPVMKSPIQRAVRKIFANDESSIGLLDRLDEVSNNEASVIIFFVMDELRIDHKLVQAMITDSVRDGLSDTQAFQKLLSFRLEAQAIYIAALPDPLSVKDTLQATKNISPGSLESMKQLLRVGGSILSRDVGLMIKHGRFEEAMALAMQFAVEGRDGLTAIRGKAEKFTSIISAEILRAANPSTVVDAQSITAVRLSEAAQLQNLITFRRPVADVLAVRRNYPLLNQKLNEAFLHLSGTKLLDPVNGAERIPLVDSKLKERLNGLDPILKTTMVNVWNRMNDPEIFAKYCLILAEDAAVEMMSGGSKSEINSLTRGELTRNAVLKVLVNRHRAQGNDRFSIITGISKHQPKPSSATRKLDTYQDFRDAIKQGPFFDKPFGAARHGIDTHFLQIDYVADVIWQSTNGNPRVLWDFLGSKKGVHAWVALFDTSGSTLGSPEYLVHLVTHLLKIVDGGV